MREALRGEQETTSKSPRTRTRIKATTRKIERVEMFDGLGIG
jgi:hypothetical protein